MLTRISGRAISGGRVSRCHPRVHPRPRSGQRRFSFVLPILTHLQAMYRDPDGATKPVETLKRLCRTYPVHLILGGVADFVCADSYYSANSDIDTWTCDTAQHACTRR